jgi:TetR/AcrR family transcriptional repressor of nem operon
MVRTRQFDPDKTLHKAMMLFWANGFINLSMEQVVKGTGVNRYSLYEEFGNKEAIFNQTLERYTELVFRHMLEPLRVGNGKPALIAYFAQFKDKLKDPRAKNGCLIFNSLESDSPIRPETMKIIKEALEEQKLLIANRLNEGINSGDITAHDNPDTLSYFVAAQLRLILAIRKNQGPEKMATYLDFQPYRLQLKSRHRWMVCAQDCS